MSVDLTILLAGAAGELIENPVTGERAVVRVPPDPANDHLLVVDLYLRPGGAVSGEHLHPSTTETFTVVRGRLNVRHDGRELQAGPGTRVQVRPGVAHDFWNAGTEEARVLVEVQPGERVAQVVRQLFLLAQDGRTNASGRPRPLQAAALAWEFADTIRFTSPPRLVQRLLSGIRHPPGAHRGAMAQLDHGDSRPLTARNDGRPRQAPHAPAGSEPHRLR
jgi:quercetin dioxygenase-like cupin family protein